MTHILLAALIAIAGAPCGWGLAAGEKAKDAQPGEVRRFELPEGEDVYCVAFSPDGRNVIAGTAGGGVWLWDVEKTKPLRNFKAASDDLLTGGVLCAAFSPDGKRMLLGCADNTVRLWDLESGRVVHSMKGHAGPVWSVTFFKDGKRALSGSTSDYAIREWDLEKGKELRQFKAQERPDSLCLSPDEHAFVTTEFKKVQLWDLESG